MEAMYYLIQLHKRRDIYCQQCPGFATCWINYKDLDYGYCDHCFRVFGDIEKLDLKMYKRRLKKFKLPYEVKTREDFEQYQIASRVMTGMAFKDLSLFLILKKEWEIRELKKREEEEKERKRLAIIAAIPAF